MGRVPDLDPNYQKELEHHLSTIAALLPKAKMNPQVLTPMRLRMPASVWTKPPCVCMNWPLSRVCVTSQR